MLTRSLIIVALGVWSGGFKFRQVWPLVIFTGYMMLFPATTKEFGASVFYTVAPSAATWAQSLGPDIWEWLKLVPAVSLWVFGIALGWVINYSLTGLTPHTERIFAGVALALILVPGMALMILDSTTTHRLAGQSYSAADPYLTVLIIIGFVLLTPLTVCNYLKYFRSLSKNGGRQ